MKEMEFSCLCFFGKIGVMRVYVFSLNFFLSVPEQSEGTEVSKIAVWHGRISVWRGGARILEWRERWRKDFGVGVWRRKDFGVGVWWRKDFGGAGMRL